MADAGWSVAAALLIILVLVTSFWIYQTTGGKDAFYDETLISEGSQYKVHI